MSKWIEIIVRSLIGLIMAIAATLTTVILSPFLLVMWLIKLFTGFSDKDNTDNTD
jgi:hypothetical protein